MQELHNITANELFALSPEEFEEYNSILQYLKAIAGKDLRELEFGQVAEIRRVFSQPDFKGIEKVFELVFDVELSKLKATEFFARFNWVVDQLKAIARMEKKLQSNDAIWEQAGGERMNIFGELNTLRALGVQYGVPPQEVEKWSYNLVFTLSYQNKELSEVQERYQKIMSRK